VLCHPARRVLRFNGRNAHNASCSGLRDGDARTVARSCTANAGVRFGLHVMKPFTERPLLWLLAAIQFTHIMDFMIMMPLGPQLMRDLSISPGQFGSLVSAYTISAGVIGLIAAPFIDRFDRKPLLLFVYAGFTGGTLACALAHHYSTLLLARAVCGMFGGISAALIMAVVSDIVPPERRASGMGIVMTAFSLAAALGVPFGLFLAQQLEWEAPFYLLAAISAVIWLLARFALPPVRGHLEHTGAGVVLDFVNLLRDRNAGLALLFAATLVFGHFILIPMFSPYLVANVGLPEKHLSLVYLLGGALTAFTAPLVGRLADRHGKQLLLTILVLVACVVTIIMTNAGPMPLGAVLCVTGAFFVFGSGRFGPGQAIMSMAVHPRQRGAFMTLNSCIRDLAAGVTTAIGAWVVTESPNGQLVNYHWLGWLAVAASLLSLWLAHRVQSREPDLSSPLMPKSVRDKSTH
jgi:MFS transporter, DHA1 family, inner membrane transport protein